ncbi:MAG: hypothetical protein U0L34_05675 [Paludibacteraceae bacterium]|nr:hypothetical protein [Paludibacteraceae bacterium]
MKLERQEDVFYKIEKIHPNELNLIRTVLGVSVELFRSVQLDDIYEPEKKERLKILEGILNELSLLKGSQKAESMDQTIFNKVVEMLSKC